MHFYSFNHREGGSEIKTLACIGPTKACCRRYEKANGCQTRDESHKSREQIASRWILSCFSKPLRLSTTTCPTCPHEEAVAKSLRVDDNASRIIFLLGPPKLSPKFRTYVSRPCIRILPALSGPVMYRPLEVCFDQGLMRWSAIVGSATLEGRSVE
jgi:hypothetical protein